jgi:hypothetical protein
VGSSWLFNVRTGNVAVVSPAIVWTAVEDGCASFVAEVTCGGDNPEPNRKSVSTWGDLASLALRNDNMAYRSDCFVSTSIRDKFFVGEGRIRIFGPFPPPGPFALELESDVPSGSSISMLEPPNTAEQKKEGTWTPITLNGGRANLDGAASRLDLEHQLRFRVEIPVDAMKGEYSLALLQKSGASDVVRSSLIFFDPTTQVG